MYWTTAVRVACPTNQTIRPSSVITTSPSGPRLDVLSMSASRTEQHCMNGVSITSVVLTNFGNRVAWVWALAEILPTDNIVSGTAEPIESSMTSNAASISIEPCRVVIGPQHSQQIIITLPSSVKSCRVVFHYGDEVLRHQVRQHYILPRSPQSREDADVPPALRKGRRKIRVADLMRTFTNEVPFPIVEVPSALRKPIRTEDWRRALSQQLSLRQHLVLNVYAVSEGIAVMSQDMHSVDQRTKTTRRSDSPITLASIHVETEAFHSQSKSTGSSDTPGDELSEHLPNLQYDKHTERKSVQPPPSTSGSDPDQASGNQPRTIQLELNPQKLLVFRSCLPLEKNTGKFPLIVFSVFPDIGHGRFTLSINAATGWPSDYLCKVMWSAFPVSDVRQHALPEAGKPRSPSYSIAKGPIFRCVGSTGASTHADCDARSIRGFGVIPLFKTKEHHKPNDLQLPFVFCPHEARSVYTQDWCITVWTQPISATRLSGEITQSRSSVDSTDRATSQFVLPITLEGQSLGSNVHSTAAMEPNHLSNVATVRSPPSTVSRTGQLITVHNGATRISRSGRVMELGPLRISGLPVHFKPIPGCSDSPHRSHEAIVIRLLYSSGSAALA
ncbi:unnamed protein product [Echinostoma caproni]|uniref:ASH domain-containing protein n=1 Tax=Echinostoma caproni TaxID=27848 RepID=A0A183ACW4_9TREM|nr:unnamed protein product [Echinostoma caproni]